MEQQRPRALRAPDTILVRTGGLSMSFYAGELNTNVSQVMKGVELRWHGIMSF
jgi:hypothetical protein